MVRSATPVARVRYFPLVQLVDVLEVTEGSAPKSPAASAYILSGDGSCTGRTRLSLHIKHVSLACDERDMNTRMCHQYTVTRPSYFTTSLGAAEEETEFLRTEALGKGI